MFAIAREFKRKGLTILLVEQNVSVSLNISQRAYVPENGRVGMSGGGMQLLNDDRVWQVCPGLWRGLSQAGTAPAATAAAA